MDNFPFKHTEYQINERIRLTVIDIKNLGAKEKTVLDHNFVRICEGQSISDIKTVKKRVRKLFSKKEERWVEGAIAEFFIHLYMAETGYKQEFLYLNLEENSFKKGFDGLYSKNGSDWVMESKSGSEESGATHRKKVLEAMSDLTNKIGKGSTNNPWQEAYSHAAHCDVGTARPLREKIKRLANDFVNEKYASIDDLNTMPCGTIFLAGISKEQEHDNIKSNIDEIKDKLNGKNVHIVCATQSSTEIFKKYINEDGQVDEQ